MSKHIAIKTILIMLPMLAVLCGCSKSESYSELLRDEEKACNWYLSNHRVETEIPADSIFECGPDAPFYRMDEEGFLYMQVINPGRKSPSPKDGDVVYFRFMRQNIKNMYEGMDAADEGNGDDMDSMVGNTRFVLGNLTLPSSSKWGTGLQMPLRYLGYESEVNLVLKSYVGFTADQSECLPYVVNVRYFKPEY